MNQKGLSNNQNEKINLKKIDRTNLMSKIGHFDSEIDSKVDQLESIEYLKIQNVLWILIRRQMNSKRKLKKSQEIFDWFFG